VLDRTLVVITSDHGENLGDQGLFDHRMSLHRSLLHIPMMIRLPGTFDGGRVVDSVVRLEDVAPTVLELCSHKTKVAMQGKSLTGDLDDRTAQAVHGTLERFEQPLREQFPSLDTRRLNRGIRSIYDGRYHLIRYDDGAVELYDVMVDPAEEHDLSVSRPGIVDRLTALDLAK
jgi:arylsulfatase A-like enzyme